LNIQPGKDPKYLFLTADHLNLASISKLTPGQAAYHFISGIPQRWLEQKGVTEPQPNFSFVAHLYAITTNTLEMLRKYKRGVQVWLINTGWTGGAYGTGSSEIEIYSFYDHSLTENLTM
jgi:phosphoenolpyruvate carboxykinase (ATP)